MAGTKLIPEKITSPFQLMAAWFAMLVLLVSILLMGAINIKNPEWAAGYLVVFTSVLVILVLGCVTLMLTVFRPHLQEGKEYAQWLRDKNTYSAGLIRSEQIVAPSKIQRNLKTSELRKKGQASFLINVSKLPDANELVHALQEAGFKASIYREDLDKMNKPEDHEAIWIGAALPANEVIKSIKIAVSQWPHLKYMHLSTDGGSPPDYVHSEMYFGGATSSAQRYGLSPWSKNELLDLDGNLSLDDFHRVVRSKYA
jgi:hypothetical protein